MSGRPSRAVGIHAHRIGVLLDHAEKLISEDSGMVVCWHEFTDEQVVTSDCVQCAVQHARDALSDLIVASRAENSQARPEA